MPVLPQAPVRLGDKIAKLILRRRTARPAPRTPVFAHETGTAPGLARKAGWPMVVPVLMPPAAAAPLSLSAVPSGTGLRDFSDRLSPMLVKELRQGLKSWVFTGGLMVMQLCLLIMALLSMEEGGNVPGITRMFWYSVAGTVCILLPMRVANALRDESAGNTLDTLLLTHLSAWRITLGKWLATCALQALVTVTVLPYLLLRYFAGGVNTPMELAMLGLFLLFGIVVTAVMLGLSWFRYFLVRAVVMLAVLLGSLLLCSGVIVSISRGRELLQPFYENMRWPGLIFWLVIAFYLAFFFLDFGASRLAPMSENRSTRRRLVALAVLLVCGTCCVLRAAWSAGPAGFGSSAVGYILANMLGVAMLLPAIQAVCERPVNLAPVLTPFIKRGWLGRITAWLLLPGWHTGVFFSLLILGSVGLTSHRLYLAYFAGVSGTGSFPSGSLPIRNYYEDTAAFLLCMTWAAVGTVVMGPVVWSLAKRMQHWGFVRWFSVIAGAGVLHLIVTATASKYSAAITYGNYAVPSGGFLVETGARVQAREKQRENFLQSNGMLNVNWRHYQEDHRRAAIGSIMIWLAVALLLALREMRVTAKAWRELEVELR